MTVFGMGKFDGLLSRVVNEHVGEEGVSDVVLQNEIGTIRENLRVGIDITKAVALRANHNIAGTGFILGGRGFVLAKEDVHRMLGPNGEENPLIYPLLNGRDLTESSRGLFTIDTIGVSEQELLREQPELYQHLHDTVYFDRQTNRDPRLRREWWLLRRSNEQVRAATRGLRRFIVTSETATHRLFVFVPSRVRPEHKLIVVGSDDAYMLGTLSSRIHTTWALAAGGRLGAGNDPVYSKTLCFDPFPFPDCAETQKNTIRGKAEQLDAHRKRQRTLHPELTLTEMYNVLEKLKINEDLTAEDRAIYDAGLVGVLCKLHEELDAAVFTAYDWPHELTDEEILSNVVALNAERRAEEESGNVRWLRPEFQAPNELLVQVAFVGLAPVESVALVRHKQPWPVTLTDQVRAIKNALRAVPMQTSQEVAAGFRPASRVRVAEILETLTALGQTRQVEDRYLL